MTQFPSSLQPPVAQWGGPSIVPPVRPQARKPFGGWMVVAILGVILAGAALGAAIGTSNNKGPAPTLAIVAGAAPTAAATETPSTDVPTPGVYVPLSTPEPTPAPAPTPNVGFEQFKEFEQHEIGFANDFVTKNTALSDDFDNYDLDSALSDAIVVQTDVEDEIGWLDSHKPTACYRDLWLEFHNGLTDYRDGLGYVISFVNNPYSTSSTTVDRGVALLKSGAAHVASATDMISATGSACGLTGSLGANG